MKLDTICQSLVDEFRSRPTLRAGSLITTVFGDAIAPRGGTLWLGSLIRVMADFGINERLVRTSVYRLANDGWFVSEQHGRRSYYSLTASGRERFVNATHRIYGTPTESWDGRWCVLLLQSLDTAARDLVRRECGWLGFGPVSADVLVHPAPNAGDTRATLERLGVARDVVVVNGRTAGGDGAMRALAHESWNLSDIDARYRAFVAGFLPALEAASAGDAPAPRTAFLIRTLLIQEYRKVILRDPQMPAALLPDNWHGSVAYRLCRDLYRGVFRAADEYLSATIETVDGRLPPPDGEFFGRFGGLPGNNRNNRQDG